ncbi:hypothetical protein LUZ60_000052 [Juncus effusus]|nr:hypothetical protein LUZ60_000052 [Juncus effusus]
MAASSNPSLQKPKLEMEPAGNDSINGLKFGKKIYFAESTSTSKSKSKSPPAPPAPAGRRGKGAAAQPPRCQVEGCDVDLTGSKTYYCRHKVCGAHSKAARVIVSGIAQRFCQQCSRFHQLAEFDQRKRSCRRRLAGHNERRRKQVPSLPTRFGHLAAEDPNRHRGYSDFTYTTNNRELWSPFIRPVNPFQAPFVGSNPYLPGPNPLGGCLDSSSAVSLLSNGARSTIPLYNSNEPLGFRADGSSCALSLLSNEGPVQIHSYNSNEPLRFRDSDGPLGFRALNGPNNPTDCLAGDTIGLNADSSCALSLLSNGSVIQSYNSNEPLEFRANEPELGRDELEFSGNELELALQGSNGPDLGGGPEFGPGFL